MRRLCPVPLLFLLLALPLTSCESRRHPSLLVIAIDRLPFQVGVCSRDEEAENSGFFTMCQESIRFTHALTTSTLSVPALASLATGLYPYQHGVRNNGSPGLSPKFRTFAEAAIERGSRTAFFSGGAPLWRRSGLHQGFEIFEDNLNLTSGRLFRPFHETMGLFKNWLKQDVGDRSFTSVVYVPDLGFPDTVTETTSGELRSLSYESQFEELDESLDAVFSELKKGKRWNDTIIVLVGLNGREISPRPGEIEPVLMNSENTQVSLFIKPAIKPRDQALQWTIDRNVSLADVGRTLLELSGERPPEVPTKEDENFPVTSLSAALKSAQPDWPEDRPILTESGWAKWQGFGEVRAATLRGSELMLFDERPLLYNTLTDRLETSPLPVHTQDTELKERLLEAGFHPWSNVSSAVRLPFRIPALDWLTPVRSSAWHRQLVTLSQDPNADPRVLRWSAESSIEQKDWPTLARLGKLTRHPLWTQVAERNQGHKATLDDVCLSLIGKKNPESNDLKNCPDDLFLSLFAWMRADVSGEGKDLARRRFLKNWEVFQQDVRILKANAGLGLIWLPLSAEDMLPSRTSLALTLPELKRFVP